MPMSARTRVFVSCALANEIADDVCAKQSAFRIIARQEFDRAEPVIFILKVRSNLMFPVHTETS
jgi:hypothetical protein